MTARSVAKSTNKPTKNTHRKHGVDDHSITRDSIISTAFDLFREKGYAKASISELARRIGMDPSSLYYYFPSKEALLAEISNPKIEVKLKFPPWKNFLLSLTAERCSSTP